MAQPIKYNTSTKTTGCCIKKGNFDIGIVPSYAYGPTSSTDFWAGYTIPAGGFISYQNKGSQGPSIYEIPSIADLIPYGKNLNIGPVTASTYVIRVCSGVNDLALVNIDYPQIPLVDDNILTLDAGYTPSYGWGGAEWYNINEGTVTQASTTGSTTFTSGTSFVNYSDSYLTMLAATQNAMALAPTFGSALQNFTVNVWFKYTNGQGYNKNQNVVGQQYSTAVNYSEQTNCNFLIRGNAVNGYEAVIRHANVDYIADFGAVGTGGWQNLTFTYDGNQLKTYLNGVPGNSSVGPGATLVSNGLQTIIGGTVNAYANTGLDDNYFDANIGVVNIYNSALDEGNVSTLYNVYKNQRNY